MRARLTIATLAAALVGAVVGCGVPASPGAFGYVADPGGSIEPATAEAAPMASMLAHHPDEAVAHHSRPGVARQVRAARVATRGFQTPGKAIKAGHALLRDKDGIACIAMPGMGGMGVHYVNGDRVDSKVELRKPEALVYRFARNGHLRLGALEYVVLQQDWEAAHGAGAARPRLFGRSFDFTPAGNRFGLPAFYSLHAWVWKHNPAGRFAMFNPRVFCPPGI